MSLPDKEEKMELVEKSSHHHKTEIGIESTFFQNRKEDRFIHQKKQSFSVQKLAVDNTDSLNAIRDKAIRELFCLDVPFDRILQQYTKDDFLKPDDNVSIPFFAEIRNYKGARESNGAVWIIRQVKGEEIVQTAISSIVYFLDRFTDSLSAPTVLTRIAGKMYRATKLITKADQLSGANYTVEKQLKEQLALDLINRWIFADEDRNPNNYLIKTTTNNRQLVIPIDFGNADLAGDPIKIKGNAKCFGWVRKEKTQYLTPLKMNVFTDFDMCFYKRRFERFDKIDAKILKKICKSILRLCPESTDTTQLTETITRNILRRIRYVKSYFERHIPACIVKTEKYSNMGQSFMKIAHGN